uniref:Serum amyloid A protein n=1 Tax=Iconisemion striatum TaxID=60296 RepID=A0A1A7W9T4_9TELE
MKLLLAGIALILIVGTEADWLDGPIQAFQGAGDMWKAYRDLKKSNFIGADKYFHARGNFDAAQRGPGGVLAAEVISYLRELVQEFSDSGFDPADSAADQVANEWGRNGGDPNRFRPKGLPDKY